jgi:2-polyprenyl-6-methoxyphenol hydroxylase-like FAD-dependent oxidoreductase
MVTADRVPPRGRLFVADEGRNMSESSGHAAVLGGGFAGLLAARVLSERYRRVTVVERDSLPDGPAQRRGIPQGRHLHGMLSRGSLVLAELFPGLPEELAAAGAQVLDEGNLSRTYARLGGFGLNRSEQFADPAPLVTYQMSRPAWEYHLRRRVAALPNVTFLAGDEVSEVLASSPDRIDGVRVADRATGAFRVLDTDLVVDAMGRAARTPALLARLGYDAPPEERSVAEAIYFSVFLSLPTPTFDEKYALVQLGHGKAVAGLMAYEDDTWVLTVGGKPAADAAPTDLEGMLAVAAQALPPHIMAGLRDAEPRGDVAEFRHHAAVWRRYDKMARFPLGLLVIGDALCSLNPIYGQGMTMASLEALALRNHLRAGDPGAPREYFRAAADHIRPTWVRNDANDRPPTRPTTRRQKLSHRVKKWAMATAFTAAEHDIVLSERILRVTSLIDPPERLQDPALIGRVLLGSVRKSMREGPAATLVPQRLVSGRR